MPSQCIDLCICDDSQSLKFKLITHHHSPVPPLARCPVQDPYSASTFGSHQELTLVLLLSRAPLQPSWHLLRVPPSLGTSSKRQGVSTAVLLISYLLNLPVLLVTSLVLTLSSFQISVILMEWIRYVQLQRWRRLEKWFKSYSGTLTYTRWRSQSL